MTLLSPLLDPARNYSLRYSTRVADELVVVLLAQGGPALSVQWLDLLVANGPLTGIPGLLTLYDVNRFARRNEALIERLLAHCWPDDGRLAPELALMDGQLLPQPLTRGLRRRRRCRAAVYLAVCASVSQHRNLFQMARAWERRRRMSPPLTSD